MLKRICTLLLVLLSLPFCAATLAAPEKTILLLGDSLGASYGMPAEQGWAYQLNAQLQKKPGHWRLVNASISGDTTAGGLARLPPLLEKEQPAVLLIELGGNDGLRGLNLGAMKSNLEKMIALARQHQAEPVLIGMKIPPNYGRKYRERFEQVFMEVSKTQNVPLLPFLLDGVGGIDAYMQDDRIHPNAKAQPVIRDLVGHFLQPLLEERINP